MEYVDRTRIKAEVDATICPIHNQHPSLILTDNNNFDLECCCDEFKEKCIELVQQRIVDQTGDHIGDMFDDLNI